MKLDNPYLLFKKKNIFFWMCFPILYLLSIIYCFVTAVLKFAYKTKILPTYRPKCKVVSVGNITLGGTGKTPLVEWIANYLIKNNKKPSIIIRGYKRPRLKQSGIISQNSGYFEIGDEASMLKDNLDDINIGIGRDKIKSARQLERRQCDIIILDDGFQHWRLRRDLDIVTIDCSHSILNQKLLPLGRLREPLSSLRRADILVLTKADLLEDNSRKLREELHKINPNALIIHSIYEPVCFHDLKTDTCLPIDSDRFKDKSVFILAGIANPIYFDKILSNLRLKIKRELLYPDHYEYRKNDLDFIKKLAKEMNVDTIITTHKDAVRLRYFLNFFKNTDIFYLKIRLKVTKGEEELRNRILSIFNS
ncbi:MAG: tetraacyldisaccharide 4'-kinase [Candidatus Omnitrophica bacterium]|nr:tetraacyldisaccharide 4'-kinase [Candidatus Omnitrophota bacterium]